MMKSHTMQTITVLVLLAGLGLTACSDSSTTGRTTSDAEAMIDSRSAAGLQWESDWEHAVARARSENKVVMVNFYADWCIWCKRLDAATLSDGEVNRLLSARCVPLKLQIDGGGRGHARTLGVDAPPTTVFVDPDGQEIGRILGYVPPTTFVERASRILHTS